MRNPQLIGVVALAAFATPALAGTNGGEWLGLDQEIAAAAASMGQTPGGPEVGALIRSSFDMSSDDIHQIGSDDLMGWRFQDALVWAQGAVGDYDWRLSFDFANSTGIPTGLGSDGISTTGPSLLDAYAKWNANENVDILWGQFKCPFLKSSMVEPDHLLFIDRTRLGQFFDAWQPGAAVIWDNQQFHAKLAVQNGADGAAEDFGMVARGEMRWNGGTGPMEGCCGTGTTESGVGAADGWAGTFGAGYFADGDEDALGDEFGSAWVVDATVTHEQLSLFAEIVNVDDELGGKTINAEEGVSESGTPWSVTVGWMLEQDTWELAARMQDLDDEDETTIIGGGLNWYQSGHAAKWQLNVSQYEDDNDDGMLFQLGLTLGSNS